MAYLKSIKSNKYDRLLILLFALQVFGGIGGAFQPVRIFIIIFIPATIIFFIKNSSITSRYKYEIATFYIWITYGLFSLIWVINIQESLKEVLYLTLYFFGFFLVVYFSSKANNPKDSIIKGWLLLFLLTIPIALVEIILDIHLPSAYHEENMIMNLGDGQFLQRRFASVTFGNLNGYNTILVYVTPFVIGNLLKNNSSSSNKIGALFLALILSYLVISNNSRAAFLCLSIILLVLLGYSYKSFKTFFGIIFTIIIVAAYFVYFKSDLFAPILYRMQSQGFEDNSRITLINSGLDALYNSFFIGIGAGNFSPIMEKIYGLNNSSAHNFFLEVLVQYGLIIFILFLGIFSKIIKKNKHNKIKHQHLIVVSSLIIYPFTSIINSGYILDFSTWLFIYSLYIVADIKYDRIPN